MKVRSEIMYPEYKLIQIVELPENGKNKYAIQYIAHMEYFDFDFRSKNSIKKFLSEGGYKSGEYLVIVDKKSTETDILLLQYASIETRNRETF